MRTPLAALLLLAFVAAAPAGAQPTRAPAAGEALYRLSCAGPLSARTTEADLRRLYGAANVTRGTIYGPEGDEIPGTILFDGDPQRRAEVIWNDAERRTGFGTLRTSGRRWSTQHGLRPGSPIAEVQRMNGRPFDLSGFGWDYGGSPNFEGGRLAPPAAPGCYISYDLAPAEDATSTQALGEATYRSDSRAVRSQRPVVGRVTLSFGD